MNFMQMSLEASVLIIAVLVSRKFLINKLPKATFLVLWLIVAVKLLFPYSLFTQLNGQTHVTNESTISPLTIIERSIQPFSRQTSAIEAMKKTATDPKFLAIWLLGATLILLFFVFSYVSSYKKFQTAIPIRTDAYLNDWLLKNKLRRPILIAESDQTTTPLTYRCFKPVIILPKTENWQDEKKIQYVLTHELIHIKRIDVFWKILLVLILAIHWFNPLVWLMFYTVNRDIELSCDEQVIRHLGLSQKADYATSLIELAEKRNTHSHFCLNFSKNGLEERIISIMKAKKISLLGASLAGFLVVGSLIVFAITGHAATVLNGGATPSQTNEPVVEVVNTTKDVTNDAAVTYEDTSSETSNEEPVVLHP